MRSSAERNRVSRTPELDMVDASVADRRTVGCMSCKTNAEHDNGALDARPRSRSFDREVSTCDKVNKPARQPFAPVRRGGAAGQMTEPADQADGVRGRREYRRSCAHRGVS